MHRHLLSRAFSVGVAAAVMVSASVGCNSILGNEEGKLRASVSTDAGDQDAQVEAGKPIGDGGLGEVECDTAQGNKVCFGLCVKINDPNTGCGGASCDSCDPKNVNAPACKGAGTTLGCGYDSCKPGFDSCDDNPANGCEASLGSKATCGSCSNDCGAQVCAFTGGIFQCVATCPAETKNCSGACVDTTSSIDNCGDCGNKCQRPLASAVCNGGTCEYTCNPGTHDCSGTCKPDISPDSCGTSCTPCPEGGENTVRVCSSGACGVRCEPGYLDCDRDASNGCELKGESCPATSDCLLPCLIGAKCCFGQCIPQSQTCKSGPVPVTP